MDLSLKQRLLGAAVLIALAVIFVPMLISGSAPQKSAEMETSTLAIPPEPDREFQTRVLPVDPAATNPTSPPAPSAPPAATPAPETIATATAPEPPPGAPAAAPAQLATATPPKPASPKPEPAKPAPETTKPSPGQAANGRYYVQLGTYANTKNARDLVASLKKGGFPASTEASEYQGKPAERVRVGPFADRAAAEAARLRIKQAQPAVPGSVVATAEDANEDAPANAVPAGRAGGWAVQLGALKTADDANKLRDRVRNAGFAAFVDKVDANGTTLWRVRAGPEVDRAAAEKLRAGIRDKLKLDGIVVTQ
ncbi:SPOR domain-containing protein [Dokdonella fugitiva]|jgi:DedD protein|uniref:DedD protein n=1 Tax=Dokdonella fugitiva TaxID=328517 RepID=A0A4R2IBN1_9GAMM|nr:SPOR domain-containing protein [Dokdonella fugitiva]TCO41934.1 DedD protein [Dokdonella fugitiva]